MDRFGRRIVALRIPILIAALVLLVPSVIGYAKTRVNYDILSYLPGDIETMAGQDILTEEFWNRRLFHVCGGRDDAKGNYGAEE